MISVINCMMLGDWKGQIEHIYAHLLEIASEDRKFRVNIGEPQFGEVQKITFISFF